MEAIETSGAVGYHSGLSSTWEQRYRKRSFRARQVVLSECLRGHSIAGSWLDAGCGTGTLSRWLTAHGCTVLGVDAAPQMIERAIALSGGQDARQLQYMRIASIAHLPLESGSLDGVLCSSVLEYVSDPELCLAQFSRVLKKSGRLLVSIPNRDSAIRKLQRRYHRMGRTLGFSWAEFMEYSHHQYSMEEFQNTLEKCGFAIEKTLPFGSSLPRVAQRNRWVGSLLMFAAHKVH
jgi:ubiquinone/menaquinone biosynthesis C-methylase UbiE